MYWAIGAVVAAVLIFFALSFVCYMKTFSVSQKQIEKPIEMMSGPQYQPYRKESDEMLASVSTIPYEDVYTKSYDGLLLHGRLYRVNDSAPTEIMFHGYRSLSIRDFSGGLKVALDMGHNVLLVTMRAHDKSEGTCLTFGVKERFDVVSWVNFINSRFGDNPIILMGMSMGSATVLMASSLDLTPNVKGIISDCGYTSPEKIIKKVIKEMRLPVKPAYFFVRAGAKIFGHFDPNECDTLEALKNSKVPVLFIHGTADTFVPYEMGVENYEACSKPKLMATVEGAPHGFSFIVNNELYMEKRNEFLKMIGL